MSVATETGVKEVVTRYVEVGSAVEGQPVWLRPHSQHSVTIEIDGKRAHVHLDKLRHGLDVIEFPNEAEK